MSKSLLTTCGRHEITISGKELCVETLLPRRRNRRIVERRWWTRGKIALPNELQEENVKLVFASARRDGIDLIVDVRGGSRAWLWRLSPARVRTVTEITYRANDTSVKKVFTDFRAEATTVSGDEPGNVSARIIIDESQGTAKAILKLYPAETVQATVEKPDAKFDLFISYKACDVEKTPCMEMIKLAKDKFLGVWFAPERLQGRTVFREPIRGAIEHSLGYLIIWSDNSPQHEKSDADAEDSEFSSTASDRQYMSSHSGGVMKMNQLWEVVYILQHANGDQAKRERVWVYDARSPEKRQIPIHEAFRSALENINTPEMLDGLNFAPYIQGEHLIQEIKTSMEAV